MKGTYRHIVLGIMLLTGVTVCGQVNDTVLIPQVSITDQHVVAPVGYKTVKPDSITLNDKATGSLSDILAMETAIYLKSYGIGSLSSVSFRGMGASHTKILWNDLPINSSMHGQVDLTNIPVNLFSSAEVQYGNASLLTGSGGIGGGIQMSSLPDFNKRFSVTVTQEFSSFNTYKTALRFTAGTQKWQSVTGFSFTKAKNDFGFKNTTKFGSPDEIQQSAAFTQYGGIQELYGKLKRGHELAVRGFVTWGDRQIPPTMLSSNQQESEKDLLLLANVEWKWNKGIHYFRDEISYKHEILAYNNEVAKIHTNDKTHTVLHIFSYIVTPLKQLTINARMENQGQIAATISYNGGNKHRTVNALYANAKYAPIKQLEMILGLRQELVDAKFTPFLPSLSINVIPSQQLGLKLYANGYRNYRTPTLNDLYWSQGGNPDLKTENAWGLEGGAMLDKKLGKDIVRLEANASGFSMWVDNWIVWLPINGALYTPRNVLKVRSSGLEARVKLVAHPGAWLIMFFSNYQYSRATVAATSAINDKSTGKDLIYTPRQTGNMTLRLDYKGWYISYTQQFVGKRYTIGDNSDSLKYFTTGNIRAGKNIHKYVPGLEIYAELTNLWNTPYQNIAWRAMPGRAYTIALHYNFIKPQKP